VAKEKSVAKDVDRKKIPVQVQLGLLMEAGYKCGNPACRNVITLELHHILYVRDGGGNGPENLLVLCPYCHALHHAGEIPIEAIRHWKSMLLSLNQAFDRGSIDLLLYLCVTDGKEIWYSGDALLRFAGLIAAGLVGFTTEKLYGHTPTTSGHIGSTPAVFHGSSYELGMKVELHLTKRGSQLVQAWRTGNEEQFRALISQPGKVQADPASRAVTA
jgi:hypothetical protein